METQYSIYRIYRCPIGNVGLLLLLLTATPATPATPATATAELCAELTTDCIIMYNTLFASIASFDLQEKLSSKLASNVGACVMLCNVL